ncbi:class I SAM-dependent methyltransferase [Candidatus Enterococcus ikei]|uniref:Class I SAM-dependent methyltransferase n=1 Tax=Candidatus Enterococcus ikei TaxID=2815326 RepID=A0ABS3GUU2_9ENTE|nr:class I SAM-dependent methyltransferase [Enterococcus sp. DIV0869a]MBO0439022.1 class I SAM-dependent methyltransferase [Enterococcus sp. DIV0869a]
MGRKAMDSWEVSYPKGVIECLDLFRDKYLQYDTFDPILHDYIQTHLESGGKRVCSLGAGTGRHEVDLAKLGYDVVGLERDALSVQMASEYINSHGVEVEMHECDFLIPDNIENCLREQEKFDVVILLFIPISMYDYNRSLQFLSRYLKPGGIFVTNCFGYRNSIDRGKRVLDSDIEVCERKSKNDIIVRLNYYEYKNDIVDWDAIYLLEEDGQLVMKRDHDTLCVMPEEEYEDPLNVDRDIFEILPNYQIWEAEDCMTPPNLYEYLVGRRMK